MCISFCVADVAGKHGGGRCQIDFYWPGHPPCDKYHQSKNAKGACVLPCPCLSKPSLFGSSGSDSGPEWARLGGL